MNLNKFSIVLLALLLSAMAIVPCVSAAEKQTASLVSNQEIDLFASMGVEKPLVSDSPGWQTYESSKKKADAILGKSGKQNDASRVIGYLEGDSEKVVLYKGADGNHYAILEKNGKIVTKPLTATVLASMKKQDNEATASGTVLSEMKTPVSSTSYELRKISLSDLGTTEFGTKSVYEAHILRTDSWVSALDPNKRSDLYTEGIFTYDYGVQILDIEDYTYSHQDFMMDRCDFSHSTRITSTKGYIDSYVIWALEMAMPPKHSVDAWISCSKTGVTGGSSQVSEWVSTGFGCFGTP